MKYASLIGHTVEALVEIRTSQLPADVVFGVFFRSRKYLGSRDRRFIAETAYGTLRNLRRCDQALEEAGAAPEHTTREGRILLEVAAELIAVEHRSDVTVDDFADLMDEADEQERVRLLVTALHQQRMNPPDRPALSPGVRWSFPDWMVDRFRREYGDAAEQIMPSLNEPAPLSLRVNTLKADRAQCRERLAKEGVEAGLSAISPVGLTLGKRINAFTLATFKEGWFEVQDEGSQVLPLLIDPKPTSKVLDACAGAGGKSLALAAIMKNRGEILATDVHDKRLDELRRRSKRAGAFNIRVRTVDRVSALEREHTGFFDIVFVDAPCSGVGTIRRNPGMKWTVTERTVAELAGKQRSILGEAAPLVRPGGSLVYATCTMFAQENEDVVEEFVRTHPEFAIEDATPRLQKLGLSNGVPGPYVKLLPHTHGTDGFFCAFLKRVPTKDELTPGSEPSPA